MQHAKVGRLNVAGRYRLLAELGHGGMANVYLAMAEGSSGIKGFHKLSVVKVLKQHLAAEQEFVQMFLDEARVAARLSHPNVVQTYEVGETEEAYFMAMEYLDGQPYRRLWNGPQRSGGTSEPLLRPTLSLPQRLYVLAQTLAALQYAHELKDFDGTPLKIVHRDVTPHNVFVTYDGQVKLVDFGIAKATSSAADTAPGIVKGKTAYMAPEQARGDKLDHRADIYSVGVMLWEAVAGRRMWHGVPSDTMMQRLVRGEIPDLRQACPAVTMEIERMCRRALSPRREERYASAASLKLEIDRILNSWPEPVTAADVGRVVAQAFEDERAQIRALVDAQIKQLGQGGYELMRLPSGPLSETSVSIETASIETPRRDSSLRPVASQTGPVAPMKSGPSRSAWLAAVVGVTVATGLVGGGAVLASRNGATDRAQGASGKGSVVGEAKGEESHMRGISRDEIRFGMSAAFSGPAKELGNGMKVGIQTCFAAVNDEGGVHGRKLSLVTLDDGYEGTRALENSKDLLDNREVFGIVGNVGTPTAEQAMPFIRERKTLFFGAFTGAGLLRQDPPDRYVINYRASYAEETAKIVGYLIDRKKVKPDEIIVFAQQDGYGNAGFSGVAKALRKYGRDDSQILRVGYKRNTTDVEAAVDEAVRYSSVTEPVRNGNQEYARIKHPVRAVVMVATYKAAARFIQKLKDKKVDPTFTNVSFVGSDALADELKELGPKYANGVIVTQVVPHYSSGATGVLQYRDQLKKHFTDQQPGFVSLEGYVVGRVLVEALKAAGPDVDTEKLVNAFESIRDLDLGIGSRITYGMSEHQGSHKVWGTMLTDSGKYEVLDLE